MSDYHYKNNHTFDIHQGKQFLNFKHNNISNTYNNSILLQQNIDYKNNIINTKKNGFFDTLNSFFSLQKEGFSGSFGDSAVNDVNNTQLKNLQQQETIFKQKMSEYSTAKQTLMEDTKNYLENANNVKQLAGTNVRLTDGSIGYVTNRGVFKHYPNMNTFNNLEGVKGCPKSFQNINASKANKNVGDLFGSEPGLYLGTPMKPNQPCTETGVNVQVTSLQDPNNVTSKLEGCYKDTITDKFTLQSDIKNSSVDACKLRAIDMGRSAYALKPNANGQMNCWIANTNVSANDVNKTISTKNIVSKSLLNGKSYGTNSVAGIMNNGELVLGNLNSQSNFLNSKDLNTFSEIPKISGCDPIYGSRINVNSASYGVNCNGQIQLESIL